jgi:hypothetical protein
MPVDIGKERNDVRWATGAKPVWAVLLREFCGDFSGLEFALRKDAKQLVSLSKLPLEYDKPLPVVIKGTTTVTARIHHHPA